MLSIIILICITVTPDDHFIIGAYAVDRLSWVNIVHDSLNLNTIHFGWPKDVIQAQKLLNEAKKASLKVILPFAPGSKENIARRLSWYCYLWYRIWESDSSYFSHNTGSKVVDNDASNCFAWKCDHQKDKPGLMQYGPVGKHAKLPMRYLYMDTLSYTARFRLKIETHNSDKRAKVCSLIVLSVGENHNIIKADSVLQVGDFPADTSYKYFDLHFLNDHSNDYQYQYHVWWFNKITLFADHVEVKDCFVDSLLDNSYDSDIKKIISYYNNLSALYRFYLNDEPYYGHFMANRYIYKFLRNNDFYGIQAIGTQGIEYYNNYLDVVEPYELMFDYYPFRGVGDKKRGITEKEHGYTFQAMLDSLCQHLSDVRNVSFNNDVKFIFIPQAFGNYDTLTSINPDEGGVEGIWRLPTPRELRCIVWLGLAYGAKGIMYYRYRTKLTLEAGYPEWTRGILRYDNKPRMPLYTEIKNINHDLSEIGSLLLSLESNNVFKSDQIPEKNIIKYIYPRYILQVGIFNDDRENIFLMLVNRHCRPTDSIQIKLGIMNTTASYLYDCLTGETIVPVVKIWANHEVEELLVDFTPGQGRLFKLDNVE